MTFLAKHPLDTVLSAALAATPEDGAHLLAVPRQRALWSVLAHSGHEAGVAAALAALDGVSVRICGPQEWLVVGQAAEASRIAASLSTLAGASVAEQGDGRAILAVSGPEVRSLLAKVTALDLHPSVFAVGRSANALVCHVAANIMRTGENSFEITVPRSYALWVYEELKLAGLDFGLSIGFAD